MAMSYRAAPIRPICAKTASTPGQDLATFQRERGEKEKKGDLKGKGPRGTHRRPERKRERSKAKKKGVT